MALEQTLALIKPDAVAANNYGKIIAKIVEADLTIKAICRKHLSDDEVALFYGEHQGKFFFDELTQFVSSGPLFALVLEGENAIKTWRTLMGATNFEEADAGTIRADFATSMNHNAVHGSDSPQSALKEIAFFFTQFECLS